MTVTQLKFVLVSFLLSVCFITNLTSDTPTPCANKKATLGPSCFLFYNCSSLEERNFVFCPSGTTFDEKLNTCTTKGPNQLKCLAQLLQTIQTEETAKNIILFMNNSTVNQLIELLGPQGFPKSKGNVSNRLSKPIFQMCEKISNRCHDFVQCGSSSSCQSSVLCGIFDDRLCDFSSSNTSPLNQPADTCDYGDVQSCFGANDMPVNCSISPKCADFIKCLYDQQFDLCNVTSSETCQFWSECVPRNNINPTLYQNTVTATITVPRNNINPTLYQNTVTVTITVPRNSIFPTTYQNTVTKSTIITGPLVSPSTTTKPVTTSGSLSSVSVTTDRTVYQAGETASFKCTSSLPLLVGFSWFINNVPISNSRRITIQNDSTKSVLVKNLLQLSDAGRYKCGVRYMDTLTDENCTTIKVYPALKVSVDVMNYSSSNSKEALVTLTCSFNQENDRVNKEKNVPRLVFWYLNDAYLNSTKLNEDANGSLINLTISQPCNVSCSVNMSQTGIAQSNKLPIKFLNEGNNTCKSEVIDGFSWLKTNAGETVERPCMKFSSGAATRLCLNNGTWDDVDSDECLLLAMEELDLQIQYMEPNETQAITSITSKIPLTLSQMRGEKILNKAIDVTYKISLKRNNCSGGGSADEAYLETMNMIRTTSDVLKSYAWRNGSSLRLNGLKVLNLVNVYSSYEWPTSEFNLNITSLNDLVFERKTGDMKMSDMIFPSIPSASGNHIKVFNKVLMNQSNSTTFLISGSMIRNLANNLVDYQNKSTISSTLISLDIIFPETLNTWKENLVEFTLQHNTKKLQNLSSSCVYWKFNSSLDGYWVTDGCTVKDSNETHTTCQCTHLTNFAILFSPSPATDLNKMILSIISLVGCIISIVALFFTIILYAARWRILKSNQAVLIINLCVSLIIANIIFLAGADQTSNHGGCTAVAALLHYFFLASFFIMLMIGIHLFVLVYFVFFKFTKSKMTFIVVLGWLLPMVIVAISLGVTKLNGYGSETNCWLSVETGVFWAFAGPALVIIFINITIVAAVLVKLCRAKMAYQNKKKESKLKSTARNLSVLCPILGITWIFGVLSVNQDLVVFQYIFAIANSLQGLFIFLFHGICLKKNRSSKKDNKPIQEKPSLSTLRVDNVRQAPETEAMQDGPLTIDEGKMRPVEYPDVPNETVVSSFRKTLSPISIRNTTSSSSSETSTTNLSISS